MILYDMILKSALLRNLTTHSQRQDPTCKQEQVLHCNAPVSLTARVHTHVRNTEGGSGPPAGRTPASLPTPAQLAYSTVWHHKPPALAPPFLCLLPTNLTLASCLLVARPLPQLSVLRACAAARRFRASRLGPRVRTHASSATTRLKGSTT